MKLCTRPRCEFPVAGVGEAYGLCVQHGHEERNRRLRERDAHAPRPTQPRPEAPLTATPAVRPLSAIVGARPVPTTIQPSAATVAAKEPSMAQSLVLKPNAASLPPSVCRIQGCDTTVGQGRGARGLCSRHHAAAHKAGRVDELGLPATTPARKPKSVAPTASKPTPTAEPHLSRSEQQIAEQQAAKEEVAKLRAERDEANKKAAEMAAKVVRLSGSHANLEAVLGQAACKLGLDGDCVPEAILLALDAQAGLQAQLEGLEQLRASDAKLRDALAASADKLQVLYGALNLDPSRDLAGQARDITAWVAVAVEAANAFGVTSPSEMKQAIDDVVADTQPATEPARPHRVKQAGGRDLGVLVGYLDQTGLFRVTSGPLAGAAYGCLYSAEPVERPELGEPETGATVWVRTSIDEVTATSILTSDGGRIPRAEWGPERFVRRPGRPTTRPASQTIPTVTDDDIPF